MKSDIERAGTPAVAVQRRVRPLKAFTSKDRYGREYVAATERVLYIHEYKNRKRWAVIDEETDTCITTLRKTKAEAMREWLNAERIVNRPNDKSSPHCRESDRGRHKNL